jgi:hypothetical protein
MRTFDRLTWLWAILLAFVLQGYVLVAAHADVTYTYTGNSFTVISPTSLGTSIDATVTLSSAPSDIGVVDASALITQFTLTAVGSDPLVSLSSASSSVVADDIVFENGVISSWDLQLDSINTPGETIELSTFNNPTWDPGVAQDTNFTYIGKPSQQAYVAGDPGTWCAVPEPNSLSLLILGLLGLGVPLKLRMKARMTC